MTFGTYYLIQCRCRLAPAERDLWDDIPGYFNSQPEAIMSAQALASQGRVVRVVDDSGGIVWASGT